PSTFTHFSFFFLLRPPPRPTLFPYTTLFRSRGPNKALRRACPAPISAATAAADRPSGYSLFLPALARPELATALHGMPCVAVMRSEEHTSELQSRGHLVCRLLLEKKKKQII